MSHVTFHLSTVWGYEAVNILSCHGIHLLPDQLWGGLQRNNEVALMDGSVGQEVGEADTSMCQIYNTSQQGSMGQGAGAELII